MLWWWVGWPYGVSLSLFVVGLRHLSTARTGAYFSVAPFLGAACAIPLLGEPIDGRLVIAGALMAVGVWLQLTERRNRQHADERRNMRTRMTMTLAMMGRNTMDGLLLNKIHRHWHRHEPLTHTHFPDANHRHRH